MRDRLAGEHRIDRIAQIVARHHAPRLAERGVLIVDATAVLDRARRRSTTTACGVIVALARFAIARSRSITAGDVSIAGTRRDARARRPRSIETSSYTSVQLRALRAGVGADALDLRRVAVGNRAVARDEDEHVRLVGGPEEVADDAVDVANLLTRAGSGRDGSAQHAETPERRANGEVAVMAYCR